MTAMNSEFDQILDKVSAPRFKENNLSMMQQEARRAGYQLDPSGMNVIRPLGTRSPVTSPGFTTAKRTAPLSAFFGGSGSGGGVTGQNYTDAMTDALSLDTRNQQGAADRQFARNNAEIEGIRSTLGIAEGNIQQGWMTGAGELDQMAGRADALGQAQEDDFLNMSKDLYADVGGNLDASAKRLVGGRDDIDEAYRLADEAAKGFGKAISEYKDLTAQEMSSVAHGIQRNAQAQLREIKGGVHPDGTPMTSGEQLDAINSVRLEANSQVQQAITPMASRFNDAVVQLKEQLAGLKMTGAEFRLKGSSLKGEIEAGVREGENIRAQLGTALTGQLLESQAGRRQLLELSANLTSQKVQIRNAAILDSARLALEGKALTAQLVQQNPETVVSLFQGLLALYSAQSAASGTTGFGGGGGGSGVPKAEGGPSQANKGGSGMPRSQNSLWGPANSNYKGQGLNSSGGSPSKKSGGVGPTSGGRTLATRVADPISFESGRTT